LYFEVPFWDANREEFISPRWKNNTDRLVKKFRLPFIFEIQIAMIEKHLYLYGKIIYHNSQCSGAQSANSAQKGRAHRQKSKDGGQSCAEQRGETVDRAGKVYYS